MAAVGVRRAARIRHCHHAHPVIDDLAQWSPWLPFADACCCAPRVPGVYLAREGEQGPLVYLGMAGSGGAGLHGRPTIYNRGKALASGLGGAVLDPAG